MWSTMYLHLSAAEPLEIVHLLDEDIGTFEVEFACICVSVLRRYDKVIDVGTAGTWVTHLMDTVLDVPFLSMVTICDWRLRKRSVQARDLIICCSRFQCSHK